MTSLANRTGGQSMLLRGDAADLAQPIEMIERSETEMRVTGPWAADFEATRLEAHEDGFAQGLADGRIAAERDVASAATLRSSEAVAALQELVSGMADQQSALNDEFSDHVTSLALTVAEAILSRELAVAEDPGKEAIARCLQSAPSGGNVVARLNPRDIETLGHLDSILEGRSVSVIPDSSLAPGDSMVQVGETRIDGRISEAMDRVREVLR